MSTATTTPKSTEPTPLYALVGATDLAVEGVRHALADAGRRQAEVQAQVQAQVEHQLEQLQAEVRRRREEVAKLFGEPKRLQAELEQVPGLVLGATMEAAAKAETRYEELAERGKTLVERLRGQKATQDLIGQGKATISRTKAAVTTARHAAEDVATSARDTIGIGKREAEAVAEMTEAVAEMTEAAAKAGVKATVEVSRGTAATARKRVARTRSVAKSAASSAVAAETAEPGAEKVGG